MGDHITEDTWNVIYSYFKENPKWLAKHQLDSYNDFVNNKIPLIFKTNNHSRVFLFDKVNQDVRYQIDIYYGGKSINRYRICPPSIYDHKLNKQRPMYPNEARLKNLTYGFDIFYSIEVDVTIKRGDTIIMDTKPLPDPTGFLENIYLGKIPIMVHSDMCVLSKIPTEALPEVGEARHEPGGYFIVDGREKVLISMERRAENIVFLSEIGDTKYGKIAEVKSSNEEAFAFARSCRVQRETEGTITVRLGQSVAFIKENNWKGKLRDVPLFIMFRALGIERDKDIIKMIVGDITTPLGKSMADTLRDCAQDSIIRELKIYNRQMAETYLEGLTSRSKSHISGTSGGLTELDKNKIARLAYLYNTMKDDFLPHVGRDYSSKAYFLAHMTRKLLLYELGFEEKTNRDTFINKRIDTSGSLLANLFMISMKNGIIYNAQRQLRRIFEFSNGEYSGPDGIVNIINENNYRNIFDFSIFISQFMGNLKRGVVGGKVGVGQQLDRTNYYSVISHIRRIVDPPPQSGAAQPEQHAINTTQFGFICPCETPEGQAVGLRKALSTLATVTIGYPTNQLKELCYQWGTIPLTSLGIMETHDKCRVFINGNWIGCIANPIHLNRILHLYRRNGLINSMTSISYYPEKDELYIFCDDGRLVRPLYIYGPGNELLIQPKDIQALVDGTKSFSEILGGRLSRSDRVGKFTTQVYLIDGPEKVLNIKITDTNLISKLETGQAPIEYVDIQEMDTLMLSPSLDIQPKLNQSVTQYTHVDLHPSMMLGALAQYSPFIHHGSLGKYLGVGASKHPQQSVSIYAENYMHRIDTSAHLANFNERPLIHGRMNKAIHNDEIGTGQTIIVAIAYYDGHNQDDAFLANSTSIEMGLFGSSYYKMYEDFERVDKKAGTEERFYNPRFKDEVEHYPSDLEPREVSNTYEHLDKFGFIKEGTYLETGKEILIGKYIQTKDAFGQIENMDASKHVKKDNIGSFVDKVFVSPGNADGMRLAKIRTCQYRKPMIGDKFSSRNGQKGTIGIALPKEDMPFTEDGVVPDFIIHPSSYPKRMTLNQLMEILYGHAAVNCGFYGLAGAFEEFDTENLGDVLENKLGLTNYGNTVLYNGRYGEQMECRIFMGPIYFQRLKLMVADKINSRAGGQRQDGIPIPGGAYTVRERSVVSGRAHGGGIKIGEMERDALISHGMFSILNERDMIRSDKFTIYVSIKTGEIAIANPYDSLYYDTLSDGPVSYQLVEGTGQGSKEIIGLDTVNKSHNAFVKVNIPYATKLMIQEVAGMGLSIRLHPRVLRVVQTLVGNGETKTLESMLLHTQSLIDDEENEIGELLESSIISHKPNVPVTAVTADELIIVNQQLDNTASTTTNDMNSESNAQNDMDNESNPQYNMTQIDNVYDTSAVNNQSYNATGQLPVNGLDMQTLDMNNLNTPDTPGTPDISNIPNNIGKLNNMDGRNIQMGSGNIVAQTNMGTEAIDAELFGMEPLSNLGRSSAINGSQSGGSRSMQTFSNMGDNNGIGEHSTLPIPSISLVGGGNDPEDNYALGLDEVENVINMQDMQAMGQSINNQTGGNMSMPNSDNHGLSPDVKPVNISGSSKDLSFMGFR